MQNRWRPHNTSLLPTADERAATLTTISQLYMDIHMAKVQFENARQWHEHVLKWLEAEICKLQAFIAPIRKLNIDVLAIIFNFVVSSSDDSEPSSSNTMSVWKLSHVCRWWRFAILSLPQLWSRIYIDSDFPNSHALLKTWLQNSQQAPVDITFGGIDKADDWGFYKHHLHKAANRIKRLELHNRWGRHGRAKCRISFPLLSQLIIRPDTHQSLGRFMKVMFGSSNSKTLFPSLRDLEIENILSIEGCYWVFRNLASLTIDDCDLENFHQVLSVCSQTLVKLDIRRASFTEVDEAYALPPVEITTLTEPWDLPALQDLTLRISPLKPIIQAPCLRRMCYFSDAPLTLVGPTEHFHDLHINNLFGPLDHDLISAPNIITLEVSGDVLGFMGFVKAHNLKLSKKLRHIHFNGFGISSSRMSEFGAFMDWLENPIAKAVIHTYM